MNKLNKQDQQKIEMLVEKYSKEQLLNETGLSKKQIASLIGAGALAGSMIIGNKLSHKDHEHHYEQRQPKIEYNNPYGINNIDYNNIKVKQELVKDYISRILSLHNKTLDDLRFNPDNLVLACYKYGYDLPLLLAQLQIESRFGTTKRAQDTNSMFSVGAYDDGRDIVKYKDQDSSIVPYIKLIQKDYLLNNRKDVEDLLRNYVNYDGKRYASNRNYEKDLKLTRDKILRLYPELENNYECLD